MEYDNMPNLIIRGFSKNIRRPLFEYGSDNKSVAIGINQIGLIANSASKLEFLVELFEKRNTSAISVTTEISPIMVEKYDFTKYFGS
jgi:hypothetical protein